MSSREQFERNISQDPLLRAAGFNPANVARHTKRVLYRDDNGMPVYQIDVVFQGGGSATKVGVLIDGKLEAPFDASARRTSEGPLVTPIHEGVPGSEILFGERRTGPEFSDPIDRSGRDLSSLRDRTSNLLLGYQGVLHSSEFDSYKSAIENATTAQDLINIQSQLVHQIEGGDAFIREESDILQAGPGTGGGGGRGSGVTGPVYRAPDERVVRDYVTGQLVNMVGNIPSDDMVEEGVQLYFRDHRANFDSLNREIDPRATVQEFIRGTPEYKTIHQARPDSEDEYNWVAVRRNAAAQGGLNIEDQEDFAITQATVAGDVPDVVEAAAVAQTQGSGSVRNTTLDRRLRGVTEGIFAGVRR